MQTLQQTGDRIKESKKTLLDTEELSITILENLHDQRKTILHSKATLDYANENISHSRTILNRMTRRVVQNKVIIGFIIFLLICAIIVIIACTL